MDKHTWDRRLLLRRGAAAGVGAAGLIATGRALVAAQATPEPAAGPAGCDPLALLPKVPAFRVTSSDVADGVQLPTPQLSGIAGAPGGQDQSPQLAWDGFPAATQSFTVTMYDADAPTGSGFWHWVVVDIPAGTTSLPAGAGAAGDAGLPTGAFHLPNDLRLAQYLGAAPPPGSGPHRYYIVVTAIDVPTLGVPKDATPAFLGFNVAGHALARAVIVPIAETVAAPATPSPSA